MHFSIPLRPEYLSAFCQAKRHLNTISNISGVSKVATEIFMPKWFCRLKKCCLLYQNVQWATSKEHTANKNETTEYATGIYISTCCKHSSPLALFIFKLLNRRININWHIFLQAHQWFLSFPFINLFISFLLL